MQAQLSLKPISDLLTESFYIPAYQRGYRWTKRQVVELLDDIWDFQSQPEAGANTFYCLQPIVVKYRDEAGDWELVDGQQRLTTIHLILNYLAELMNALGQQSFRLRYETRLDSETFLQQKIDTSQAGKNIDYFHICQAYEAIAGWFADRHGSHRMKVLQTLVNDESAGKNVKVIWYELPAAQPAIPAFTRLNVGKIPLTNAELVRALFLRSDNFDAASVAEEQLRIAGEWDDIEKCLQSDDFWYFMHSGTAIPQNRIEYLFDIHASSEHWVAEPGDAYSTFHFFTLRLNGKQQAQEEWLKVKRSFMALQEWFEDRELYHLVGFLIHEGHSVRALRDLAQGVPKSAFRIRLRQEIAERLALEDATLADAESVREAVADRLADLQYGKRPQLIRAVLLLFNVATLLANRRSNLRFPFEAFKKEAWDIEHVRAVASQKPNKADAQHRWLAKVGEYFSQRPQDRKLSQRIQELMHTEGHDPAGFDALYDDILRHVGESSDTDVDHGIGNLALLDQSTNRAYKNAIFPVKRQWILRLDEAGTFVPLCTRNLFLKAYSKQVGELLFWSETDATSYREAMTTILSKFFIGNSEAI